MIIMPDRKPMMLWVAFIAAFISMLLMPLTASAEIEDAEQPEPNPDAAPQLHSYTASFGASMDKGIAIDGDATRSLESKGPNLWLYRFDVNSFVADIDESLFFMWQDGRVVPLEYRYKLSGLLIRNRERQLSFDWTENRVTGKFEKNKVDMPLQPGDLDPLGFQLQLRQDLKAGKTDVTYRVIDDDRFDTDRFRVIGSEKEIFHDQEYETVKVEKVRGANSKRETLIWFAPELDYMLVQLRQTEPNGSEYMTRLKTVTGLPQQ